MENENIMKRSIGSHIKKYASKIRHKRAVLIIMAIAGGSYAAYRYIRNSRSKRAQELSERLRSERKETGQCDRECTSAYFEGYKNGLDDGYDEGYERGYSEGHFKGCDDGYMVGCEEMLKKCISDANRKSDVYTDEEDENEEEDKAHEDNE
jgi:flagellar biosynthesis/type III secretory pathway protein FliH